LTSPSNVVESAIRSMSEIPNIAENKKVDSLSLVDRVYETLLERIISGAIRYGDTISIKKVAAELSVSSMPVREAMKRLEFEGVVTIKPRSACRVRLPSRRMILEVYELREALEAFAVMRRQGKIDPSTLGRMQDIVEKMRGLSAEQDADAREKMAIELDRQFHAEIIGLAGNEMLNAFSRQLSLHVNMTLMHEKTYHSLEKEWSEMHAEVLACIQSDPPRAVALLHDHFARATALWKANGSQE
jgi:DNA-binding GntR family transcriptional regulator